MAIIQDPSTGLAARVIDTSHSALVVRATDIDYITHISEDDESAYSWTSATYDTDAGDTLLLVKNTNASALLHIHKVDIWTDTASRVTFHTTDGASFTPTGTAVTGVNLNRASGKVASATAKADETGNTQGNIVLASYAEANKTNDWDFDDAIVLGNGDLFAVDLVTAGTGATVTFTGFYVTH